MTVGFTDHSMGVKGTLYDLTKEELLKVGTRVMLLNTILKRGMKTIVITNKFKVALGVCFALKSWKEYLLLFTYLITLGKDVTLSLITKFKTNRPLSNLFVNRILN